MTKDRIVISNRLIWLIFATIFLLLLLFNVSFLLKIPPVWPDESLFADSALNLLNENRIGTDLYNGMVPGAEKFGWGYPPLYFYTTAAWFKFFGFSIFNQRLLSLCLGVLFLFLFFKIVRKITNNQISTHKLSFLILLTLLLSFTTDPAFVKAVHISRPEIEVLVLGFIALLFYLKSMTEKSGNIFSITAGLFLSLAFLSHYLAIIFAMGILLHSLLIDPKKFLKTKKNYLLLFSFLIPIFGWLLLISGDFNYLLNDITLRLKYKTNAPYWIWIVFSSSPLLTKIQYLFYFITTWELFLTCWITKNKNGILILLLLILSWFWTYIWQTEYSFIYTITFVYMSLIFLICSNFNLKDHISRFKFKILFTLALIMLISNSWYGYDQLAAFSDENFDYNLYTYKILELVPDNTTVYLSAIPDPYYGFKGYRNNKLYQYPGLPIEKNNLIKILDETDYIIFNSPLESIVVGDVVNPYIKTNAADIMVVGGNSQYQAFVIRLKPRNARAR